MKFDRLHFSFEDEKKWKQTRNSSLGNVFCPVFLDMKLFWLAIIYSSFFPGCLENCFLSKAVKKFWGGSISKGWPWQWGENFQFCFFEIAGSQIACFGPIYVYLVSEWMGKQQFELKRKGVNNSHQKTMASKISVNKSHYHWDFRNLRQTSGLA